MSTVINGKNVAIQFYKGDDYYPFMCAKSVSITFNTETKSVKTLGDGPWAKPRGQAIGYRIACDGLVSYPFVDEEVIAFDLLFYQINFLTVAFRIIFNDQQDGLLKVITGHALPIECNLSANPDFLDSSFTLVGDGAPQISDNITSCSATVGSVTFEGEGIGSIDEIPVEFAYSSVSAGIPRLEFSIDDGPRQVVLDPGTSGTFEGVVPNSGGNVSHTIEVWPVCDNGEDGISFTLVFSAG